MTTVVTPTNSAAGVRWNLNDLFAGPDDPQLAEGLDRADALAAHFETAYRGQINTPGGPSVERLLAALGKLEQLYDLMYRVGGYTSLAFAANTQDPAILNAQQRVQQRLTAVRNRILFFDLEWQAVEDEAAERLLADPRLADYAHSLRVERMYKPHTLSEAEEKIVNEKDIAGTQAWRRLFTETTSALMIPVPRDDGVEKMTLDATLALMRDPDRPTRQAAHDALYEVLATQEHLRAYIYDSIVQDRLTMDRLRHYPDPMAAQHLSNQIEPRAVQTMMEVVEANYGLAHQYWRLKGRLLGLDKPTIYDQYAPVGQTSHKLGYAESQAIILDALAGFTPEFAAIARQFFDKSWIDAEVRPAKSGGAFCAGVTPSLHPYILCNYNDNLRDCLTVAHELGHGIHDVLSARKQNIFHYHPSLPVAETASVFAEITVFDHLVQRQGSQADQLALLCGTIEDMMATVFRQNVLTRYEQQAYAARAGQRLSPDLLKQFWWDANAPYYGDALQMTEGYRWGWSYIPHFIGTRFYTYAYVFGELLVLALYTLYREQGAAFVPGFIRLLESGGSAAPADLVKPLGIDLQDPQFWQKGFDELGRLINWAQRLADGRLN